MQAVFWITRWSERLKACPCKQRQKNAFIQKHNAWVWQQFNSSPENQQILCQAWGVSKALLDAKFGKLIEQGIEPNPGPSVPCKRVFATAKEKWRQSKHFSLISLNTGGAPKVWTAIDIFIQGAQHPVDILSLQEASLSASEFAAVQRHLSSLGYIVHYTPGVATNTVTGHSIPKHGVLTAVACHLPCQKLFETTFEQASMFQTLAVQVGSWVVVNTYVPPRDHEHQTNVAEAVTNFFLFHDLNRESVPWIWVGDFNADYEDSIFGEAAQIFNGSITEQLVGKPTRWEGRRTVDHLYSNHWHSIGDVQLLSSAISDRIPLHCCLQQDNCREVSRGVLKPATDWSKPNNVAAAAWQELLQTVWRPLSRVRSALDGPPQVDLEWDYFVEALNNLFNEATHRLNPHATRGGKEIPFKCNRFLAGNAFA